MGLGGNDILNGNVGDDSINGGEGLDTITGGTDNDELFGGAGADQLNGGTGSDLLKGGDDADTLEGGVGDDTLFGGSGNDSLEGGVGDDVFIDGAGSDFMHGGLGINTVSYSPASASAVVDLANSDNNEGAAIGDFQFGIQNLIGTNHDDELRGNAVNNEIDGGDGIDLLYSEALWHHTEDLYFDFSQWSVVINYADYSLTHVERSRAL